MLVLAVAVVVTALTLSALKSFHLRQQYADSDLLLQQHQQGLS